MLKVLTFWRPFCSHFDLPNTEKRDRLNAQKLYVGYKNGLEINKELAEKDAWTVQDIIDRTDELVEMLLDMYKL